VIAFKRIVRPVWLRAIMYMVAVAGGWLVVLPAVVIIAEHGKFEIAFRNTLYLGMVLIGTGAVLGLVSGYYLISRGQGTPFPLDPTHELVTSGP
jgi:hypothetical protein